MSITDELREWAVNHRAELDMGQLYPAMIECIADRIDAEHEAACAKAYGDGAMSVPIALDESQWVKLPKDADGVPIHVGDVMAYADNTKPMEVVALVPPAVFLTEDGPRYADMCRHYHAPTVEGVLREFADRVCNSGHQWGLDAADTIAEYAAKLRLAEGKDA